jgi:hypothetical protein
MENPKKMSAIEEMFYQTWLERKRPSSWIFMKLSRVFSLAILILLVFFSVYFEAFWTDSVGVSLLLSLQIVNLILNKYLDHINRNKYESIFNKSKIK